MHIMIKFFRRIRKSLHMETGKTGKYLKYAIGEIGLVAIGILVAYAYPQPLKGRAPLLISHLNLKLIYGG